MTKSNRREQSVKDTLKVKRDATGVDYNILLKKYFIDEFLRLLSKSDYSSNFIWKGGFVLSAITGVEKRTTVDIDTVLRGVTVDTESLTNIVTQITSLSDNTGCQYILRGIGSIQEEKAYQGLRIYLLGTLGQMQEKFHLDIATGESLIPSAIFLAYQPLIGRPIGINIYRPERILVEKIQTILTRSVANTRMKDFIDVYLISSPVTTIEITPSLLTEAMRSVLAERGTTDLLEDWQVTMDFIADDLLMAQRWDEFQTKHDFVGNISFADTIKATRKCIEIILPGMQ